jgi:hypothetical protein
MTVCQDAFMTRTELRNLSCSLCYGPVCLPFVRYELKNRDLFICSACCVKHVGVCRDMREVNEILSPRAVSHE